MRVDELDSGDPRLPLIAVDNGTVALTFLPAVGGRLLSLRHGARELLWRNPDYFDEALRAVRPRDSWPAIDGTFGSWANVGGSKTWPAPQGWNGDGEWPGPPDAVLDAGPWSVAVTTGDGATVTMSSPPDPRSGLRIERSFAIPEAGPRFRQRIRFTNVVNRVVRWSVWEVCQVVTAPGDTVEVLSSDESIVDLGTYRGRLESRWSAGRHVIPVQPVVAKRGFPSGAGSIALRGVLELAFPVSDAPYPDAGSRAELWMQHPVLEPIAELSGLHPDAWLAELEALSPLHTLAPGASAEFEIDWRALG